MTQQKRILVLTGDMLGERMAGPAIRALEMGRVLASRHRVTISCPNILGRIPEVPDNLDICAFGVEPRWSDLKMYDTVIIPASMHVDACIDTPMLVDLYDPFILSSLSRSDKTEEKQTEELGSLLRNLQRGDFFVCASERQRDFWLGMLSAVGRVNIRQFRTGSHLESLIVPVPFGIDSIHPVPIPWDFPGDPHDSWMVWAGGIWDWFDPLTAIYAVQKLNQSGRKVSIYFMGTSHPNPRMTRMAMARQAQDLAEKLGLKDRKVFFGDWIPYDRRCDVLARATLGISTHYPHLETHFSFRTRILDYIWTRLPFICTDGDVFGDLAQQRGIGLAIPPESVDAMVEAVIRMLDDKEFYNSCKQNLAFVAADMTWGKVLKPVMDFCSNPSRACDIDRPPVLSGDTIDRVTDGCETAVSPAGEIIGNGIEQTIRISKGGVYRIDLKLATYNRHNDDHGIFELVDSRRRSQVRIPFTLSGVEDNHWYTFRFGPVSSKPDSLWTIRLTCPLSRPGNAITIWVDDSISENFYEINGERKAGSINYRVFCRDYPGADKDTQWRSRRWLGIPWPRNL